MKRLNVRLATVLVLLLSAALFLHARQKAERLPAYEPLGALPLQIGQWQGRQLGISPEIREVLGNGHFLSRLYSNSPSAPPVDLFVAFFPSQRSGSTIHSPKNCLPGSGWTPMESAILDLHVPGRPSLRINRYVIAKGNSRQLALYWYQAHGRAVASEYWAKFYLVADSIRMNRTDGSLIRIITPVSSQETVEAAQSRALGFASAVVPQLDSYIPR